MSDLRRSVSLFGASVVALGLGLSGATYAELLVIGVPFMLGGAFAMRALEYGWRFVESHLTNVSKPARRLMKKLDRVADSHQRQEEINNAAARSARIAPDNGDCVA
jgi:hypothetical protein